MINRKQALFGITDKDEKNLISLLCDKADKAILSGARMYSRFLSPAHTRLIKERLGKDVLISFFGGYDDAERTIACLSSPDTYETDYSYPISAIKVTAKSKKVFSHRDYLGSLMSLGIKRELLGDIVLSDTYAVVFCHEEICDFLTMNLTSIGKNSVEATAVSNDSLNLGPRQFKEKSTTVSSMRLDCVLSSAIGKSRSISSELISKGLTQVNYEYVKSPSSQISDGDIISVRGFGKMVVLTDSTLTKKGRYHITIKQYV